MDTCRQQHPRMHYWLEYWTRCPVCMKNLQLLMLVCPPLIHAYPSPVLLHRRTSFLAV